MTLPPPSLDDDDLPPLDSSPAFSLAPAIESSPPHPPLPLPDQLSPQDSPPIQAPSLSPLLLSTPRPSSTAPLSPPSVRGGWPSQDARSSPHPAVGEEDEGEGAEEDTPRPSLMQEPAKEEEDGVRTFVSMDRLLLASLDDDGDGDGEAFEAEKREERGPPTPLGLPGGWMHSGRRRKGKERADEQEEDEEEDDVALLLPPPFLTDDSARESFDGLLNSRPSTHRRLARLRLEQERLHSLGRAPPAPFPQSVWKGVGKVVRLLGPPGGFQGRKGRAVEEEGGKGADEERKEEETRRRRVKRAESGVKAFEVGMKVGRKVAGRLERHRSWRAGLGGVVGESTQPMVEGREEEKEEKKEGRERRMRAATPSDLLGSPPQLAFTSSSSSSFPYLSTPPSLPPPPPADPSSPTLTPLDAFPLLEPLFPHAAAPLPTVQTPFTLDPMEELDEGYFGLRRRGSRKRRKDSLGGDNSFAAPSSSSPAKSTFSLPHVPSSASSSTATTTTWPSHLLDLLIYLLIGSPSPPPPPSHLTLHALDTSYASLGGLLGLLIHLIGFAFFLLYHLSALIVSSYFAAKTGGVWVYWAGRNLSGRTEVSRSVREYWRTCRGEWGRVCEEEGERRLGVVEVVRALLELAALQSMTRHRFLSSGPGNLKLLNGPSSPSFPSPPSPRLPPSATPRFGPSLLRRRTSQHLPRLDPRPAFTQRASSYRWTSGGDEQDGEGLVVEKQGGGVLEGSLISHGWEEREEWMGGKGRKASRVVTPKVVPLSLGQAVVAGKATTDDHHDPAPLDLDGSSPNSPTSPPLFPLPEHPTTPLLSLLTTLKRHCRLATASYGLHVYLVDAPTPLLTPSGKTLPHRVFAHLGGMSDHRNVLHVALQKRYDEGEGRGRAQRAIGGKGERTREEKEAMPYAPTFYLLRDDANGEIVCVIRGTQSLADVRTDLDGDFVDLPLPPPHPPSATSSSSSSSSPPTYRIHSSILSTAQHLLSPPSSSSSSSPAPPPSPLFDKLRQILHDHPRYSLTFTGHSLGAALASTLAVLLGAYNGERGEWYVDPGSELAKRAKGEEAKEEGGEEEQVFRRPLRAVCFAHPTTVCANLAARCALPYASNSASSSTTAEEGGTKGEEVEDEEEKGTPLVVNVSLGADVICRMGIPHVRELRRAIGQLDRLRSARRKEEGEEGILSGWWRWRKAAGRLAESEGEEGEEARREKEELEEKAWGLRREVERWDAPEVVEGDGGETAIPAGKCYHLDRLSPDLEARRRKELREEGGDGKEEEEDEPLFGLWAVRDSRRFYRMPQLEGDLVAAHMPKAYLDAVDALTL